MSDYEVLPTIRDEAQEATIVASYTPNNGIRIGIINDDANPDAWAEFDFDDDQAEALGLALIRWAKSRRNERRP